MADLVQKLRVRKGQRSIVDRRLTEIDSSMADLEAGGDMDKVKLYSLKRGLEEKMSASKRLDEEIVLLTTNDEEVVKELEEADGYSRSMYERSAIRFVRRTQFSGFPRAEKLKT